MARARKNTKSNSVKVNFKGVESRQTPAEGDYKLEVLEANSKTGPSGDMIEFILEIGEGKYKGTKLWFYCPLAENSLWKLHAFLTALGEEVPEDEMDIDLSDMIGKEIIGVLTHETYQGKKRAKMTDFCSVDDYEGELAGGDAEDEDEDDKKSSKKSAKGKASKKDEPEAPDYDEMDEDELREAYLERELGTKKEAKKLDEDELREALTEADEAAAKASKKGSSKKSSKKDDEEEDDGKSAKGKKGAAKKASRKKTYTTDEVEDMDEDELQELIDEHDLDVDLEDKKLKKLEKKVAAVVEALEEADLIED